jgi:hypothetical protein
LSKTKILREEIEEENIVYSALVIETKNGLIVLLSQGEENLGTLAVSLPKRKGMIGSPLSSILLGERNSIISRLFAEHLVKKTNKIVIVSVFMKDLDNKKSMRIFNNLLKKILKEK